MRIDIERYLKLTTLSHDDDPITPLDIFLAIIDDSQFHIQASSQIAFLRSLYPKDMRDRFLNLDFLTHFTNIPNIDRNLIDLIDLCIDKIDFRL